MKSTGKKKKFGLKDRLYIWMFQHVLNELEAEVVRVMGYGHFIVDAKGHGRMTILIPWTQSLY